MPGGVLLSASMLTRVLRAPAHGGNRMNWEIKDMGRTHGIVDAHVDSGAELLIWDFVLGSPFDLCAVFLWDGKMTLEDYQKKGERPYLYHRRSKTYRSTAYDGGPHGYALYPAMLDQEGCALCLGSRGCHVEPGCAPRRVTVPVICLRKRFVFGPYPVKALELETGEEKLYYRITRGGSMLDPVYEVDTDKRFCIYLERDEDVRFFEDRGCTRGLRSAFRRI